MRRFDGDEVAVTHAVLRGRVRMDRERVLRLDLEQQRVVLRARMRVARLLPVDEVERVLGAREPVAWGVGRHRGDGLAVRVGLRREPRGAEIYATRPRVEAGQGHAVDDDADGRAAACAWLVEDER